MNKQEFLKILSNIKEPVYSKTGEASYSKLKISGSTLSFVRNNTNKNWRISIDELYDAYCNLNYIDTIRIRKYVNNRVYSPACAILMAMNLYDGNGNKISNPVITDTSHTEPTYEEEIETANQDNVKDENRFFTALKFDYQKFLVSKSIYKPVTSEHIYLDKDYRKMNFPKEINTAIEAALKALGSDFNLNKGSLSDKVDGMVINHPDLGTRIIEFDEEQHFTPARKIILESFTENDIVFKDLYSELTEHPTVFSFAMKKHRISKFEKDDPLNYAELLELLKDYDTSKNGYIREKEGFPFKGGRIAQRAYYDLLRDLAHLSPHNSGLQPIIRIPKILIQAKYTKEFSDLTYKEIQDEFNSILAEVYKIKV